MTAARERTLPRIDVDPGVYAPQEDSILLCRAIADRSDVNGARVLDLCTGSGIGGIEAARSGARHVLAYDISSKAVACAFRNSETNGVRIDVRLGTIADAVREPAFDLIVSNPPYVPSPEPPQGTGLHRAWDAGDRGRVVIDPLCAEAHRLLAPGGTLLLLQSEFSGIEESLERLRETGLTAEVTHRQTIDFGPVMLGRAGWMEATGRIEAGCRRELLVVIEARRPDATD